MVLSRQWTPVYSDFFSVPIPGTEKLKPKDILSIRIVLLGFSFLINAYASEGSEFLDRTAYFNESMIRQKIGNIMTAKCLRKAIETITKLKILREDENTVGLPEILVVGQKYRRQVYKEDHQRRNQTASNMPVREEKKKEKEKENKPTGISTPQVNIETSELDPKDLRLLQDADKKAQVIKSAMNTSGRDLVLINDIINSKFR